MPLVINFLFTELLYESSITLFLLVYLSVYLPTCVFSSTHPPAVIKHCLFMCYERVALEGGLKGEGESFQLLFTAGFIFTIFLQDLGLVSILQAANCGECRRADVEYVTSISSA